MSYQYILLVLYCCYIRRKQNCNLVVLILGMGHNKQQKSQKEGKMRGSCKC